MLVNRRTGQGVFGQPNGTFSIYVKDGDTISLSVKNYLLIQKARFPNEFMDLYEIDERVVQNKILKLKKFTLRSYHTNKQTLSANNLSPWISINLIFHSPSTLQ
jgi:hypothetical protein